MDTETLIQRLWMKANEIRHYGGNSESAELFEAAAKALDELQTQFRQYKDKTARLNNLLDTRGKEIRKLVEKLNVQATDLQPEE